MMCALLLAAPMFPLAGWLSDRGGRRPVIVAGFLLAAATLLPGYMLLAVAVRSGLAFGATLALLCGLLALWKMPETRHRDISR